MKSINATAAILLAVILGLTGCQTTEPVVATAKPPPPVTPATHSRYEYALSLMQSGQNERALSTLKQISGSQPGLAGPHVNLGILYLRANNLHQAVKELTTALQLNPANAVAHNHLGIVYRLQGNFDEALKSYQRALKIKSDYANAHLNLGILYDIYLGDLKNALRHYRRYQSLTGDSDKKVAKWIVDIERRAAKSG